MDCGDTNPGPQRGTDANPLKYFSNTFYNPNLLLATLATSGSVLSGSRALEFFVPGSTTPDSDWDFYVPGYQESVISMVSALQQCGVTWQTCGDALIAEIEQGGSKFVSRQSLECIYSWMRNLPPETASLLLGETLHCVMETYKGLRMCSNAESYYIETKNDELCVLPVQGASQCQSAYSDGNGRAFSILQGDIQTRRGSQNVQLIIGSYYSGIKSSMAFIKDFYASHVQCFISGWCAGHLYYKEAKERLSILWNADKSLPVQKAIRKYSERGFRFIGATRKRPTERHLYDEGSLLIDYGEIYQEILQQPSSNLAPLQLDERRNNVKDIRWFEVGGRIFSFHDIYENMSRSASKVAPINSYFALSDGDYLSHDAIATLVKSGTVYDGLRSATPWSWAL